MRKIVLFTLCLCAFTALFAQSAEDELKFYKRISASTEKRTFLNALEWDLNSWLNRNPDSDLAPDALITKAIVEYKARQSTPAYLTVLKYVYEFPDKKLPKDLVGRILEEFPSRQQADLAQALSPKNLPNTTEDRLNLYFTTANTLNLRNSLDYLLKEYASFFSRFPEYENKDKIELLLGDLYRNNGNYLAALSKYDKVWQIYPSTKYKAASLRMKGDIYASEIRDYKLAREYYKRVLKDFPNSVEVPTVYKHWALLEAENRNYATAVENAQNAYEGYLKDGQNVKAYGALMFKAEVQEKDLKNYNAAVETLKVAADTLKDKEDYFVEAKQREAYIQARNLRDPYAERSVMEEIAAAYPKTENGVQALYRVAELTESFGENETAKEKYNQVILNRPQSKMAVKAQKRIKALEKSAHKAAQKAEKEKAQEQQKTQEQPAQELTSDATPKTEKPAKQPVE